MLMSVLVQRASQLLSSEVENSVESFKPAFVKRGDIFLDFSIRGSISFIGVEAKLVFVHTLVLLRKAFSQYANIGNIIYIYIIKYLYNCCYLVQVKIFIERYFEHQQLQVTTCPRIQRTKPKTTKISVVNICYSYFPVLLSLSSAHAESFLGNM